MNKVIYTCPMHPEIQEENPGMCPECGMALVETKDRSSHKATGRHGEAAHGGHDCCGGGHSSSHPSSHEAAKDKLDNPTSPRLRGAGKHGGHSTNIFAKKFWVSLVLTLPIVLYSPLPQMWLNWTPPTFPGWQFLPLILGTIVFFYGGWVFVSSAWREIKGKAPGMMTLISLAIVTAYVYSVFQVLTHLRQGLPPGMTSAEAFGGQGGSSETLFWELTTLIVVMLLGHWMEMKAVKGAQGALKELSKLLPDEAEVERDGKTGKVSLELLKTGDVVVIRPGGKVAADGEVIEGESDIDEALATGESKPVSKHVGDGVIAGTINGSGSLRVKVTKIGDDTFLAGVMRLVKEAQASKSKLQLLSDRAAYYLTIVAVSAGLLSFFTWIIVSQNPDFALKRLVAVLVIACPHALGLAIPLVASISTTMAARNGFLVRDRLALEAARNIDVVLFDKTGTLTEGEYGVTGVYPVAGKSEQDVLKMAAAVDAKSEHSVSRAIVKKAGEDGVTIASASDFKRLPGKGVSGIVDDQTIKVGGLSLWEDSKLSLPNEVSQKLSGENEAGKTIIYVIVGDQLEGVIALGDVIRKESKEAIKLLKEQGVQVAMMTGDSEAVAKWVAGELDIEKYYAEVLPEHKADKVKELQGQGRKVAMVGDGINDAPALMQADVGVAIGAGTNVAIESAGIVLVKNDPRDIPKIIRLSRLTYRKMIQNLWWASGYNIVAIPLAAGVAVAWGIVLNPAVSAVFMSLSTVIVAGNAVLLKRQSLTGKKA